MSHLCSRRGGDGGWLVSHKAFGRSSLSVTFS
uniref:Uncharacterized protein n=1 Tax=Anguilla anguilla TaxID=7936 RepID=A0A0E9W6Y2_ANGAN